MLNLLCETKGDFSSVKIISANYPLVSGHEVSMFAKNMIICMIPFHVTQDIIIRHHGTSWYM